ncbi:MAG: hypothetical protein FJZ92_10790 [Chloroflexi bacterium]|nr:hypothetical protein [Chloroflexota bacterium]
MALTGIIGGRSRYAAVRFPVASAAAAAIFVVGLAIGGSDRPVEPGTPVPTVDYQESTLGLLLVRVTFPVRVSDA